MGKDVEQGFLDSARSRAHPLSLGYFETPPSRVSSYDSHAASPLHFNLYFTSNALYGLRVHAQNDFSKVFSFCQPLLCVAGIFQSEYLIDQWFGSREFHEIQQPREVLSGS